MVAFCVGVLNWDKLSRVLDGDNDGPLGGDARVRDVEGRER